MNSNQIRVKLIEDNLYTAIDDLVNEWLKEHDVEIINITFNQNNDQCLCYIVYKI